MTQHMKNDLVWFITGASKGFGLALVKQLLANGNKVAATSRHAADIEKQIKINKENLLTLTVDITNDDNVNKAIRDTIDRFGRLDVVVNNAGYMIIGSIEALSDKEFRQAMDVNLFGTVNVIRNAMHYLRKQGSGHIINFSSTAGYKGFGNAGNYNASKFAVNGLSEALAEEVKPFGIKVTVVAPGYFRTNFLDNGSAMVTANNIPDYHTETLVAGMQQMNGKQSGDPEKLVGVLIDLTHNDNPPLHLLMGKDAYKTVTEKRKIEDQEFEDWKDITISTDFE